MYTILPTSLITLYSAQMCHKNYSNVDNKYFIFPLPIVQALLEIWTLLPVFIAYFFIHPVLCNSIAYTNLQSQVSPSI